MTNHPFNEPRAKPLPDANDIGHRKLDGVSAPGSLSASSNSVGDRSHLKWLLIGLLGIGLLLGALTTTGVVWTMRQLDLTESPAAEGIDR